MPSPVRISVAVLGALVALGALGASAPARVMSHRSAAFTARTADLNRDGQIDTIYVSRGGRRFRLHRLRVVGYRVLGTAWQGRDYRVTVAPKGRPDTDERPLVYVDGVKVRSADGAAPVVLGAATTDPRRDGHIGLIDVRLSEPPATRGLRSAFTVDGYQIAAAVAHGSLVDLSLAEHSGFDTGARPPVTVSGLSDAAGNRAGRTVMTPTDQAPPILIAANTADPDGDGRIDAVNLLLSEPVSVDGGAVQVDGHQVIGTRDYPSGLLTALISESSTPDSGSSPQVTLEGQGLRDAAGNPLASDAFAVTPNAAPVLVAARDEGFWLTGERVVTVWSGPVQLNDSAGAGAFALRTAQGTPVPGTSLSPGDASNEIAVNLPLAAETPTQVSYTGGGSGPVADLQGKAGIASPASIPVATSPRHFAGTLTDPFSPSQMMTFGYRSFWLQPWRSYIDTFPATRMLNAVGINFNVNRTHQEISAGIQLLHDAGFTRARVDVPWSAMDYSHPDQLSAYSLSEFTYELQQFRANGIRPLFLLDGNDGIPCPVQAVTLNVTTPAPASATVVQLDSASAALVQPGLTGFNQYGRDAGVIITSVDASGLATLARPLQAALPAGPIRATDLRFQPFFPEYNSDGTTNVTNLATLAGWLQYVAGVTQTAKAILGSDNFDVEVWNELSFGSAFLSASNYYVPAPSGWGDVPKELLTATVNYLRDPTSGVADVGVGDGFTNQVPWAGGSVEVAGVTAMDKHPYAGATSYPRTPPENLAPLDAFGNLAGTQGSGGWTDGFIPSFTSDFPEYFLSGIQTETLTRDLSPNLSDIYGILHGRGTHPPGGPAPQLWLTEVNDGAPSNFVSADGNSQSPVSGADARHFETKAILRYLSAWVGKGVTAIDFYAAANAGNLNLIDPGFWGLADSTNGYPGLTAGGETMVALRRYLDAFGGAQTLPETQSISLQSISDYNGGYQFAGNGTPQFPPLYNRNVLGFFPFQLSAHRWVIPTYVMTRNLGTLYNTSAPATDVTRQDMPQEVFRLDIGGVNPATVTATATDPLTGSSVPVKIAERAANTVSLELPLTDSPRMLTLQDS